MHITLRDPIKFISGHLLEHVSAQKSYKVRQSSFRAGVQILDDNENLIWISKTCIKRYFYKT